MMYPRLKLARNLLTADGVIFISIDDNELFNLKKLCDEIFGEENFVTTLSWRRRKTQANLAKNFAPVHDYILVYAKNLNSIKLNKVPYSEEFIKKTFKNPDNDPRGPYQTGPLARPANSSNREYELELPNGRKISAKWSCSQETFNKYVSENRLVILRGGEGMPRIKIFLSELEGQIPNTWLDHIATNDEGSKEIENIFGSNAFFSFPKPTNLIKYLLNIGSNEDSIILDFFSGSATTAHATMQLNSEDNGNRKFIMVQLFELTDEKSEAYKAGYKNICEIGKERIRRAGDKILEESDNKDLDIGFKVFKLDSSNLEKWDPDYDNLEQTLLTNKENIKPDRTELDLIYEIMLKYGIDLTLPIEKLNNIYSIGYGALLICLEDNITKEIAEEIIKLKSDDISRIVFKESGFKSDADKTNIKENLRINNIDEFITI